MIKPGTTKLAYCSEIHTYLCGAGDKSIKKNKTLLRVVGSGKKNGDMIRKGHKRVSLTFPVLTNVTTCLYISQLNSLK